MDNTNTYIVMNEQICNNNDLILYIMEFIIIAHPKIISNVQLSCSAFRLWKKKKLYKMKQNWLFINLENSVGKKKSDALRRNNLAELYLDNKNLGDVDAKWVGKMLELNTISLKKLILSDNNISVKGMKSLGEALKSNTSLVKLDLYNQIDDNGIRYIIDGLKYNNTLIELTIWKNTISESVRKELYDIQRYKLHGTNGYKEMDEFYIWS